MRVKYVEGMHSHACLMRSFCTANFAFTEEVLVVSLANGVFAFISVISDEPSRLIAGRFGWKAFCTYHRVCIYCGKTVTKHRETSWLMRRLIRCLRVAIDSIRFEPVNHNHKSPCFALPHKKNNTQSDRINVPGSIPRGRWLKIV